ncbi:MAG: thioredoxin [Lachnospiraceae bacterium]|nr:thioredoxin [Lachnospiraceae bacterium]
MEYKFTKENFQEEVLNSKEPVLVDFYADWCMPCQMMGPVVEKLADQYEGSVKVGKININEQEEIAAKYHVMSIPYFAVFQNGQIVESVVGAAPKEILEEKLNKVLA